MRRRGGTGSRVPVTRHCRTNDEGEGSPKGEARSFPEDVA